jgi:hypothetical protein
MLRQLTIAALLFAEAVAIGCPLAAVPGDHDRQSAAVDGQSAEHRSTERGQLQPGPRPPATEGADIRLIEGVSARSWTELRDVKHLLIADAAAVSRIASPASVVETSESAAQPFPDALRNLPLLL